MIDVIVHPQYHHPVADLISIIVRPIVGAIRRAAVAILMSIGWGIADVANIAAFSSLVAQEPRLAQASQVWSSAVGKPLLARAGSHEVVRDESGERILYPATNTSSYLVSAAE